MHRPTVEVYERRAADYAVRRPPRHLHRARALARAALPGLPVVDLGCGPGPYVETLGGGARGVVALDAAPAMLELARRQGPGALPVQADLDALPFRARSFGAAWARNSYLHLARPRLPLALAQLHATLALGAPLVMSVLAGEGEGPHPHDDFPGRWFVRWQPEPLAELVGGAGFDVDRLEVDHEVVWVSARRGRTLADTVGPGMKVLVCGLNPSVIAADAGYGYATPSNRFWRAAVESGLVTRSRDPLHALVVDGVGITDLVKRATPGAGELTADEYRRGAERVRRLVEWLAPRLVLFVGLTGWRQAVDARAEAGPQPGGFGGAAAYVMPSTSGLNAHARLDELVDHMRRARALAER